MREEGPGCVADVLRLPRRALGSHPHDQPDRINVATVSLRYRRTKGSASRVACLTVVFKLMESASKTWRALNGSTLVVEVFAAVRFADGVKETVA